MKGLKCFGLLLVLATIFGLSLSVCSNDTNALKYQVDKIPIAFPGSSTANPNFYWNVPAFEVETSSDISLDNLLGQQYVVSMYNDNGTCKGRAFTKIPWVNTPSSGHYQINYSFNGYDDLDGFPSSFGTFDQCLSTKPLIDYDSNSVGDLVGLSTSMNRSDLTSMLPYRFKYDGFYRTDMRDSDGLYYGVKFDLSNVFGSQGYPSTIYDLYLPFGSAKSSVRSTFTNDMPIEFSGEFVIDPADFSTPFGFSSSTSLELETYYVSSSGYRSKLSSCSYTVGRDDPNDSTSVYNLNYSCPTTLLPSSGTDSWDPSVEFPYFRLHIHFDYETSNTKFFQFIYDSSVSITNNDSTDGGSWDDPVDGSDTHDAPGSAYQTEVDGEPDYDYSLINMFNFIFINPFRPIFDLFSDNSTCASIPTIAGLIHSEETHVCPWFDSNVRNIVTPVLGLSSMMLIFGFAVRWLGARSGNFVEDSGGVDSGGFHFENKYRRKK